MGGLECQCVRMLERVTQKKVIHMGNKICSFHAVMLVTPFHITRHITRHYNYKGKEDQRTWKCRQNTASETFLS